MKIAVTGLVGPHRARALVPALRADGHEVLRLVRRTPRTADEHRWDPQHRRIDPAVLADVDAVINLAGASFAPRPWTRAYEQRLLTQPGGQHRDDQRGAGSGRRSRPGRDPACCSRRPGVGYYGDTGDRVVDEDGPAGTGFLAEMPRPVGGGHGSRRGGRGPRRAPADRPGDRAAALR